MTTTPIPSIRDASRILFRQKNRVLVTFLIVTVLTGAFVAYVPREYESEAKLYIRVGRENTAIDPIASPGDSMQITSERASEIKSLMEIIASRGVLEAVAKNVGAESILAQKLVENNAGETAPKRTVGGIEAVSDFARSLLGGLVDQNVTADEQAVRALSRWVSVESEKKSHLINVRCVCRSPRLAQRIVEEVVAEFQKRHILAHQSEGSIGFFEQQRERLKTEMDEAARKLRDAKNATGVVSIPIQRDIIRSEINNINNAIAMAASELADAKSKASKIRRRNPEASAGLELVGMMPDEQFATAVSNKSLDLMRDSLFNLQLKEQELASKYLENHPARKAIQEQLREGERIMAEQEILVESSNVGKWTAHLATLDRKMGEAEVKLQDLNRSEVQVKEAEDYVARITKAYTQYEENLEVARIDEALQEQRITNVRVVQDATLQFKSVKPKKSLLAIMGMMGAFVASLAVGIGSEYFDPTLKTNDEVESQLGMPVLVSIPRMTEHRVQMN